MDLMSSRLFSILRLFQRLVRRPQRQEHTLLNGCNTPPPLRPPPPLLLFAAPPLLPHILPPPALTAFRSETESVVAAQQWPSFKPPQGHSPSVPMTTVMVGTDCHISSAQVAASKICQRLLILPLLQWKFDPGVLPYDAVIIQSNAKCLKTVWLKTFNGSSYILESTK